ncbi:MAG: ABC transporter ATP-binding protein [Anaerolineales bacterium]|nr:ABC transporter ATP-binding protein [Anaerolineales bacterium]
MNNVLEVRHLRKTYAKTVAVDDLSLEVRAGEIFGMVGPNGAGKTTTIECLEGLRRPDRGEIRVLGLDPVRQERELRYVIGTQLQKSQLPDQLTVGEILDLFASFYPDPAPWPELLARLGLAEKRNAWFSKLSGGQQQRVFIALALINRPKLVFLDELTTGLDPQARRSIWDLVRDVRDGGCTVFLTTHFMEEAETLCDRVAIIDRGKIVALETPAALVADLGSEARVLFKTRNALDPQALKALDGATRVERDGDEVIVYGRAPRPGEPALIGAVVNWLSAQGAAYSDIRMEQPNLEDVFLQLTGRAMRD